MKSSEKVHKMFRKSSQNFHTKLITQERNLHTQINHQKCRRRRTKPRRKEPQISRSTRC